MRDLDCSKLTGTRRERRDPDSEARLAVMVRNLRCPARDEAGWIKEAQDLYDGLSRECESDNDEPCSLTPEFSEFVLELRAERFKPASNNPRPYTANIEDASLTRIDLVAYGRSRRTCGCGTPGRMSGDGTKGHALGSGMSRRPKHFRTI